MVEKSKKGDESHVTWENLFFKKDASILKDFFISVINETPTSLIVLDSKGEFSSCNRAAYLSVGCKSEKEFEKGFKDFLYGNKSDVYDDEQLSDHIEKAIALGKHSFSWLKRDIKGEISDLKIKLIETEFEDDIGGQYIFGFIHDANIFSEDLKDERSFAFIMKSILDRSPLCLNLWNVNKKNVMCNQKAVELFDVTDEQEYLEKFFKLSPLYQPSGEKSSELALKYVDEAFEVGFKQFLWLHKNLKGDDVPCEITLSRMLSPDGSHMVVGFTRDLRPELAGSKYYTNIENYFYDQISEKALFQSMSQLTDELFFTLDLRTSMIRYFGKGKELLGLQDEKTLFPYAFLDAGIVYEEDRDIFMEMHQNMQNGVFRQYDIRLITAEKTPRYHTVIYNVKFNNKGKPIVIIGKIVDVHDRRELELQAKMDLLTNCYNKVSAEITITKTIREQSDRQHALFIIDIDNFKAINDNLGHHFGDLVLSDIANKLKEHFRSRDIIGRVGGDEFIVFAENITDIKVIEEKAKKIAEAFNNTYSGEDEEYKVSGSIGVARYPDDGSSYEDLYKSADKALYQSKMRGKDCYTFYSKDLLDGTMKNRTAFENANRMVNTYFDPELISSVFNLLYESKNIHKAIDASMQVIGKRLLVDRCYIFESMDEGQTYDNTYEWCKEGVNPEIDNLQGLTKEVLEDFFRDSTEDGVLYCNDLRTLKAVGAYELMAEQDIKSFLHIQINDKEKVKFFLGLDDCTKPRVWNEKEINSLAYCAKLFSSFLLFDNN